MHAEDELHLDHAATSWPKAPGVADAVRRWYEELGVDASRGDGRRSAMVGAIVARTRTRLARMLGVHARHVAFTSGATESLNLFLRAFLRPGDRVVTTAIEHSSLVRPLLALREERDLTVEVVPCDDTGRVDPDAVRAALHAAARTRLVALCHASNVTGAVQDAAAIVRTAHELGARLLLDASQTAGVLDLAVGADAIVASAHKGLLGPPGLGFLAIAPDLNLPPVKQGGTGSAKDLERHPDAWPHAYEAGTPNTPAILGLAAALGWLDERGDPAGQRRSSLRAVDALRAELREARGEGVSFQSPADGDAHLPILSFTLGDLDPAEVGIVLAGAGVHVRTGFHCAPWIHRFLGTHDTGSVRVSPGPFVSADELLAVARTLAR